MANKKFLNPINLVNLSSDPSTASEGDIYYNTTDDVVKVYANGTWVAIGSGGGIEVSTTAPASPVIGDAWYKNDAGEFYVYDGTYWVEVNGVVASNTFSTISVSGQSNVVADSSTDTLTLVAGTNVSITTDATSDSITINSTGAYTSVDSITYPDYITFDTTPETSSSDQGTLSWNVNDGTLDLKLSSDVTLQLGQEQHVRVHNATGSTIPNGTVVYVNGASDEHGHISVAPYVADGSVNVFNVMGLTTAAIPDDADGYVTLSGLVRGLNTSSYTAGQSVFASDTVPGGLTTTQPISPSETVSLGVVTVSHATQGIIFVQIDTGATADLVTYDHDTSLLEATNVAAALNELAYKKADINALSSSLVVYPTSVESNISGYYRMVESIDDPDYNDTAVNTSTGDLNGTGSAHLISSLVADANIFVGTPGSINVTTIGNIRKTSGNANAYSEFFFRLYKRTSGGTETLLGSSSTTGAINPTTLNSYEQFSASGNFLISNFTATDRLVIKYYSNILDDGTQSYEFQFGGTEPVRTLLPVPISVTPASNASGTIVDTSSFSGVLSGADSTVQAALNTIDDIVEIPDQTGHNGEFLKTTGSALEWATAASDIDSLTDVAIDSEVSDNELLAFDVTTGVWKNQTPAEAGIATETYVGTAISNLVDTAPSTLDTLNELAAALGDDPNFATTISTALGTKAPIASPTFTGTVNIPTLNLTNALGYQYGGTGLTSLGTAGQFLKVNSGATGLEWTNSGADGIGYKVQASSLTHDLSYESVQLGISNWQFSGVNSYTVGDKVRLSRTVTINLGGTPTPEIEEIKGIITSITGTNFDLDVYYVNQNYDIYPSDDGPYNTDTNTFNVSITADTGDPGIGYVKDASWGGFGMPYGYVTLDSTYIARTVNPTTFASLPHAYQVGNRVKLTNKNSPSQYFEGVVTELGDYYGDPGIKVLVDYISSETIFRTAAWDLNLVIVNGQDGQDGEDGQDGQDGQDGPEYDVTLSSNYKYLEIKKLLASDPESNNYFGNSVAISSDGNTAIVGAQGNSLPGLTQQGAAYVFTLVAGVWTEQQKLLASDPETGGLFGRSVAISPDGNTVVVGAYGENTSPNTDNGAAYVFTLVAGVWTEQQKLLASDPETNANFGESVAISLGGNTILIGADFEDTSPSPNNGAVYVFTLSGGVWAEQQKLLASDYDYNAFFGRSVAISSDGNTALIGATQSVTSGSLGGSAYVFIRSAGVWTQQQKLSVSGAFQWTEFGGSVALSSDGNTALIGAESTDTSPNTDNGTAYIFTRSGSTWTQQQELLPLDASTNSYFGGSVALSSDGTKAFVGGWGSSGGIDSGSIYIFTRSESAWIQKQKVQPSDPVAYQYDYFGGSLAVSANGQTVLVGAYQESTSPSFANGAVYILNARVAADPGVGYNITLNTTNETETGYWWMTDKYVSLIETQKVISSDVQDYDSFGNSVDISADGNTAIASTYTESTSPNFNNGTVYIYTKSGTTWTEQAKLLASDKENYDYFGWSVSISQDGNTAAIGAIYEDSSPNYNNGAVYVFTRSGSTWTQQAKLLASDAESNGIFGISVSISLDGSTLVVGADRQDASTTNDDKGAAYVFTRSGSTWTQQAKLTASDGTLNDSFGGSVSVSGDGGTIAVGAPYKDQNNGAVYLFTSSLGVWTQKQIIKPTKPIPGEYFGRILKLAKYSNTLVVGSNSKYVYVFQKDSFDWSQKQRLSASDTSISNFATSIAISADASSILVGNTEKYSAYLFVTNSGGAPWIQKQKIKSSDAEPYDSFGFSVALDASGYNALIGATSESTSPNNGNGAGYFYSLLGSKLVFPFDTDTGAYTSGIAVQAVSTTNPSNSLNGILTLAGSGNSYITPTSVNGSFVANGSYQLRLNLVGETGPTGAAGADGADGLGYDVVVSANYSNIETLKLINLDISDTDEFGRSLSLSSDGNTVIVGARVGGTNQSLNEGAAYIYVKSGGVWTQQAKLMASDKQDYEYFGVSVSISSDGNTAVVGASYENTSPNSYNGAAYVFTRSGSTWTQQQKLISSDRQDYEFFGESVSISGNGNTVVIGCRNDDILTSGDDRGSAFIFTRSGSTWSQQQKLTASDGGSYDSFGYSVDISSDGNTVAIGAYTEDTSPNFDNGAVYVFTKSGSTWSQQAKLLASDTEGYGNFGNSLSLSSDGNTIIIGSVYEDTPPNNDNGAAYIFTRAGSTWTQQAKLTASDAEQGSQFGSSVDISENGNKVLVGSTYSSYGITPSSGSVYVYTRSGSTWTQEQKLLVSDLKSYLLFGWSVSISGDGNTAFAGAPDKSAYFFDFINSVPVLNWGSNNPMSAYADLGYAKAVDINNPLNYSVGTLKLPKLKDMYYLKPDITSGNFVLGNKYSVRLNVAGTVSQGVRWTEVVPVGSPITTLTGSDDYGNILAYTPGTEQVFVNGILIARGIDYTATNGSSVVLVTALVTGDIVEIIGNTAFSIANTYTKAEVDNKLEEHMVIALSDEYSILTTGTAKVTIRSPYAITLTQIPRASVNTASTSGLPTIDIKKNGITILGANKLTIDANEKTSVSAATATTLATTSIADDDEITFDVTVAGTGTKGLKVILYYKRA
jgi:hypothetical protein